MKDYRIDYADYWLVMHERMGDYSSSKSKAIEKMYLNFLQNKTNNSIHTPRPAYRAPDMDIFNKLKVYNELKYKTYNMELKMGVMSLFAGAKFTCTAMILVVLVNST